MKTNVVKGILLFIAGGAVGSAGTYFYLKRNNKIEYEYVKPASAKPDDKEEETKEEPKITVDMVDGDIMAYYNEAASNVETSFVDYTKIDRPKVEDVPKEKRPNIVELTEQEFIDGELGFEKRTYAYYEGDGSLIDETEGTDEAIDDAENTIGKELLEKFQNDPDSAEMYVRNLMYGTDYEIYKKAGKYSEVIEMDYEDEEE